MATIGSACPSTTRRRARCTATAAPQRVCARTILSRLASQAFRHPATERDLVPLMTLYQKGAADGFESGVRMALEGILASPRFVFRFEETPSLPRRSALGAKANAYALSDADLASRVSF